MKKIICAVLTIIMVISCKKENVSSYVSSDKSNLVTGGSITFSKNIRPKGYQTFDSTKHRFIVDSFYCSVDVVTQRVTLTVNDAGSITRNVIMYIDKERASRKLVTESRYEAYTRYFDFYKHDTIKAGWHDLKFEGTSYPQYDSLNIFYSVYQGDFLCYDLSGNVVDVYGLPIIKIKRHQ